MSDLVWSSFLSLAVLTFYLGWFEKETARRIIDYIASIVFWVATMIIWMVDNPNDFTITWVYLLPITISIFQVFQSATEYMNEGFQGYKRDPWAE